MAPIFHFCAQASISSDAILYGGKMMIRNFHIITFCFVMWAMTISPSYSLDNISREAHDAVNENPIVEAVLKSETNGLDDDHYISIVKVTLSGGQSERTHTHPGGEILFALSGNGAVYIDGVRYELKSGDAIEVNEGQTKSLHNESPVEPFTVLAILILEKSLPVIRFEEN